MWPKLAYLAPASLAVALATPHAVAHGVLGDRFFPATLLTDDPFAADELALPTITLFGHETDYETEWSKSIMPGFAVSIDAGYAVTRDASGWEDISLKPTLELYRNEDHETIVTGAFIWNIGGSGTKLISDRASNYAPEVLFGKGFGDLPDSLALLKPLAVTGQLGVQISGTRGQSDIAIWSGAIEYSLLYLQNNVRDEGLPVFVARFSPVVEFSMQTPTDAFVGTTTGTINPGLFWSGQFFQISAEAMVPVDRASGHVVGAIAQLHIYVDDLFPETLGRPLIRS